jgi:hypothetical protein
VRPAASARPTPSRTAALALAALPLALLGCGGSADVAATSSSTAAASSTSSGTTAAETSTEPSSVPPSASTSASTSAETGKRLQITVNGKQVSPAPGTFELGVGEKLTLTVTSDVANELHVHGFDVEQELRPGRPATLELVGKEQGTFEVETHEPALLLTKIAVR